MFMSYLREKAKPSHGNGCAMCIHDVNSNRDRILLADNDTFLSLFDGVWIAMVWNVGMFELRSKSLYLTSKISEHSKGVVCTKEIDPIISLFPIHY